MKRATKYLLGLLGFGAAASSCIMRVEYGCPHVDYKVSGQVVNEEGQPVKGIGVYAAEGAQDERYKPEYAAHYMADTTGVDGKFNIVAEGITYPEVILMVDTDGAENGQYDTTKVAVTFKQTGKGDGHWFDGTYEASDLKLVIKRTKEK